MTANPPSHQHDYLDFDIEITAGIDGGYAVRARSAAGEARRGMQFPFDRIELENRLLTLENALLRSAVQHRLALTPQQTAVQEFGRELFETLLAGTVRDLYVLSGQLAVQYRGLRLRLHVDPPELAALPWELLFDSDAQRYLSLDDHRPIVRYVDAVGPLQALKVNGPLRILAMTASPKNLPPLKVERERQRLERAVAELRATQQVVLTWVQGETWRDLKRALQRDEWHMFHFIGHGAFDRQADEGYLALCDEAGEAAPFFASQFALLLSNQPTLRLAVLNACEGGRGGTGDTMSSVAARLARDGMPAVIAMQYAIGDDAAIEFAQALYEAIATEKSVETAVTEGRQAMLFVNRHTVEWGVPMLYLRTLDSTLFTVVPPTEDLGALTAKLEAAAARNDWDAAIAMGEEILRQSPLHPSRPTIVKAYNGRGYVFYGQGKFEEAWRDYNRALELDPQSVVAYNGRGYMYYAQGKLEEALRDLERAQELDPQLVNTYNNRGLVHHAQGKLEEALRDYNRALEIDPQHVYAYNNRGLVYKAQNDIQRARADFERAAELGYEDAKKELQTL